MGIHYPSVKVTTSSVKSDHKAVITSVVPIKSINKTTLTHWIRPHTPAQIANFKRYLSDNYFQLPNSNNTQSLFDEFYNYLLYLLNKFFPLKRITVSNNDPYFVTPYIKLLLREKNKLMRSNKIPQAEAITNRIKQLIISNNSRRLRGENGKRNPRSMWKAVNSILSGKAVNEEFYNNLTAEIMNKHYAKISTDLNYKQPSYKSSVPIYNHKFFELHEVYFALLHLQKTATGPDKIPYWLIKFGAEYLSPTLTLLINNSLQNSYVPKQWKCAEIVPIPKTQKPCEPSDLRPISITPVLTRLVEKMIVRKYLSKVFTNPSSNPSFNDQFAFRPHGSTTAAIIAILSHITDSLETNPYVRLICLDFSKAFDTVRHYNLLKKAADLPIDDSVFNWLVNYFANHAHKTRFKGACSEEKEINAGVIQGSAIGPFAFSIIAKDLKPVSHGNNIVKYADDTYLVVPASNDGTIQTELHYITDWASRNNLGLNTLKSKEIIFTGRRTNLNPPNIPNITRVDDINILGVTFDNKLRISKHVDNILNRSHSCLYALKVLKHYGLQESNIHLVFNANILSRLTYASQAWWGFSNKDEKRRLQSFLKRCIKWGYCNKNCQQLEVTMLNYDAKLFRKIVNNGPSHTLHQFLPGRNPRSNNLILPLITQHNQKNFIIRALHQDSIFT